MQGFELGAWQAADAVASGKLDAEQLLRSCLARIDEFEDSVGAWAHIDADHALEQAREADRVRRAGREIGPLHGVPVGIKDIIDTEDFPTEYGSALQAGRRPMRDAFLVSLLREAGAIILGKTVTAEMAVLTPGKTRNPHDSTLTPGGSSSGSAAAVAAYMVPLAVGTQTNGSVIRPASFCGVFGFKPTHGRISRSGVLMQSRRLDTVGVFARGLDDLGLAADVLMRHDADDPDMRPRAGPQIRRTLSSEPPMPPRIAFVRSPVWDRAAAGTRDAFRELIDQAEFDIDILDLPARFDQAHADLKRINEADLAFSYAGFYDRGAEQLSDGLRGILDSGRAVLATEYQRAVANIDVYNELLDDIYQDYDAILTPAAPGPAPAAASTGDPAFCTIWSLCGMPALNLPIFQDQQGLPIGAQLVGQRGDDARLFRTARWLVDQLDSE